MTVIIEELEERKDIIVPFETEEGRVNSVGLEMIS